MNTLDYRDYRCLEETRRLIDRLVKDGQFTKAYLIKALFDERNEDLLAVLKEEK